MSIISSASMISSTKGSNKYPDVAFCVVQGKLDSKWYFDSGSTKHMTNDINFFTSLNSDYRSKVRVADKRLVNVYGIGNGEISCVNRAGYESKLKLENVLYVRDFESGLISVRVLDEEGYNILIRDGVLTVYKTSVEVAVGTLRGDMYELKTLDRAWTVNEGHSKNCIHVWHRRFGHRDPEAIKRLADEELVSGMKLEACSVKKFCEDCVKGKMTRSPFPKESSGTSDAPLQLIHTDVCGPMQTMTPGKRRYALTLIDDYSRFTHVFLLREKSEVPQIILDFIEHLKTKFKTKPQAIRSDRGREYISQRLTDHLRRKRIQLQLTVPYSPQQNGVAERKNRTLMEAARTMLLDANLSKKYWGEAIVTAAYLQNRLPTRSRPRTPYELWYGTKPDASNLYIRM